MGKSAIHSDPGLSSTPDESSGSQIEDSNSRQEAFQSPRNLPRWTAQNSDNCPNSWTNMGRGSVRYEAKLSKNEKMSAVKVVTDLR